MHQHPRSPAPAAPPSASRPGANRSDDRPNSPAFDPRVQLTRGLGIETEARSSGQTSSSRPAKEAISKLNQLVTVWLGIGF